MRLKPTAIEVEKTLTTPRPEHFCYITFFRELANLQNRKDRNSFIARTRRRRAALQFCERKGASNDTNSNNTGEAPECSSLTDLLALPEIKRSLTSQDTLALTQNPQLVHRFVESAQKRVKTLEEMFGKKTN